MRKQLRRGDQYSYDFKSEFAVWMHLGHQGKLFVERFGEDKVLMSFPNFVHWRCRTQLCIVDRAPVTKQLPFERHSSPKIHFLLLKDFDRFCAQSGARIEKRIPPAKARLSPAKFATTLFAEQAVCVVSKD